MKPNVIVALLVGLVVGFAVGKVFNGPQAGGDAARPGLVVAAAGGESEASLALKSGDMPAGTFTGMSDGQKYAVMKVMNDNNCDCGCGKGSLANCVKTDPNCPNSPAKLKQAVEFARGGKTAPEIQAAMFGAGAPRAAAPRPADDSATVYKMPVEGSPTKGPATAPVTIVEITDYQCPFCSRANTTIGQLEKEYGPKIRLVVKQNPLPFHNNAKAAALAALAAGEQGKYFEMHEKLFANQGALDDASLEKYAQEIGVNVAKWKQQMQEPKLTALIGRDQGVAQEAGATGTPAFFINGRKISGAQPAENFKRVIDEELAKAEAMVKNGVKPEQVYAKVMESAGSAPAQAAAPSAPPPAAIRKVEAPADSPAKGPKAAKVTVVLWSDFQCPFCSRAVPTLKQIEDTYGKDVKVVFRHQPLPFHNNARFAAEASMAANDQGKFWPMHDKLFANQGALDRENVEKYAKELGLDMGKFKAAVDSGKFKAKIDADMAAGNEVGANGTPTFYINGRQLVGAQPFPAFQSIIDEEIKKADALIAGGTKLEAVYAKLIEQGMAAAPAPAPNAPSAPPPPAAVQNIAVGASPAKGPANAPVTIIAFSDFQCPFCSRVVPTLKQIEDTYKGKVKIAFKNQPLPFHNNARPAAAASLAANEQGKFWEMHDKLFANQGALDRPSLEKYAQELGLDMGKFRQALDSNKFEAQIAADSQEGNRVGANGTPTFFINGRQLVGAQPFDQFKAVIDDELQKKGVK
ncbi:MAG: DsbA family protein [Myxococcaceae bacterium]